MVKMSRDRWVSFERSQNAFFCTNSDGLRGGLGFHQEPGNCYMRGCAEEEGARRDTIIHDHGV